MGEAWIASAPSHRERPAATQETQRLLRVRVDRASGYLAWRFDQTWATVLLPRLHTLSRIHDPRANGRPSRRGGPRRRRDRGVGLRLRTSLLQKTSLAVATDKPTRFRSDIVMCLALITTTDAEEKRHGGTSQEVSQEVWEKGGE